MQIEKSIVAQITITGAERLDPIRVCLEDIAPNKGRITISCYTKSWTAYWGSMGERTIERFFCSCNEHYIAKNLDVGIDETIIDSESIKDGCKKRVITERRKRDISKDDARELCDEIEDAVVGDDGWSDPDLMQKVFGDEWWYALPTKPNPDYAYLCRIINAVQQALTNSAQASAIH
ncbi:hypothetical protein [Collimonas humicola]|uniref:hypothetical protein n=1 Tax=Collimonas humicola TaxID=2825886 RepID=UPI001B8D41C0|nr:hypothetical protein [Collimonas humicola]